MPRGVQIERSRALADSFIARLDPHYWGHASGPRHPSPPGKRKPHTEYAAPQNSSGIGWRLGWLPRCARVVQNVPFFPSRAILRRTFPRPFYHQGAL
jgi:hypothetical protein